MDEKDLNSIPEQEDTEQKEAFGEEIQLEDNDNWVFDAEVATAGIEDMLVSDYPEDDESDEENENTEEQSSAKAVSSEGSQVQITLNKEKLQFIPVAICVALIAAIVAVFGVRYYTVPNSKEGRLMNPASVVATVDGTPISAGMYSYYYSSVVSYYESYASYGQVSLDTTKSYDEQMTVDDDGNEISWADMFKQETMNQIHYITVYYNKALEEGVELTDTQKSTIEDQLGALQATANETYGTGEAKMSQQKKSLNNYIQSQFGRYVSEDTIRAMLEQYYYAMNYRGLFATEPLDEEYLANFTSEHEQEYYSVDMLYLAIPYDSSTEETANASTEQAEEIMAQMSDEASIKELVPEIYADYIANDAQQMVEQGGGEVSEEEAQESSLENYYSRIYLTLSYSDAKTYFNDDIVNWAFTDGESSIGDKTYYSDSEAGYTYILLKNSDPYRDESQLYSVRHILVTPDTAVDAQSDNASTDEEKQSFIDKVKGLFKKDDTAEAETDTAQTEDTQTEQAQQSYTEEQLAEARNSAQLILDKFTSDNGTEKDFALLAEQISADPGSTTASGQNDVFGGLYQINDETNFVQPFKDWTFDESRQYGDTGLVDSDYGTHIMFFVNSQPAYLAQLEKDARTALLDEMLSAEPKFYNKRISKVLSNYKVEAPASTQTQTQAQTQAQAQAQPAE